MDLTGLLSNIYEATLAIDFGRKGFATKGKAEEGRVLYEDGRAHRTRLGNILRSPGIDPIEKELLQQRLENMPVAQVGYVEKQKKIFENHLI